MTSILSPDIQSANNNPVSMKVIEAVAQAEGTDPLDLDVPLARVVDTDALDSLWGTAGKGITVEFTYTGYCATIDEDGDVYASKRITQ